MSNMAFVAACAAAGMIAGCSAPADSGAPPPAADERHAVADATAMIPPAELTGGSDATATATAPDTGKSDASTPARVPKLPYRTPLPVQSPAR